ncbi:hypothetical protein GQ53DRAFT_886462 [Thozetella sp. PMI_491]|nr:hypothetical protein GQ53DRAFT_886462 [Thozetella sp. PMI_491]
MADAAETIRHVQKLFPDLAAAVDKRNSSKPDSQSRSLARHLTNEAVLYGQFVRKLLLRSKSSATHDTELSQRIQASLGANTAARLSARLKRLEAALRSLKVDLAGTEVLNKLKPRVPDTRCMISSNPFQRRLKEVSTINKDLTTYLVDLQAPLPVPSLLETKGSQWQTRPTKEGVAEIDQTDASSNPSQKYDPGSSVTPVSEGADNEAHSYCTLNEEEAAFLLCLSDTQWKEHATALGDLILNKNQGVDQKHREALAFRLSAAILWLSNTHWVDRTWSWNDCTISIDQKNGSHPQSSSTSRIFYSLRLAVERLSQPSAAWRIMAPDPILTKLGLIIIELAFGQSLEQIREIECDIFADDIFEITDSDALDLLTAKRLLVLRRISEKFGLELEAAVSACINQQYRESISACVVDLDSGDPSYLESSVLAILAPLYQMVQGHFRCVRPILLGWCCC